MQRCEGAQGKDAGGFIKKAKEDGHGRVDRLNEIARQRSWRISQSQDVFRHGEPGRLEKRELSLPNLDTGSPARY